MKRKQTNKQTNSQVFFFFLKHPINENQMVILALSFNMTFLDGF